MILGDFDLYRVVDNRRRIAHQLSFIIYAPPVHNKVLKVLAVLFQLLQVHLYLLLVLVGCDA